MKLLISCKESSRLLSDRLDRPLGSGERARLKFHLALCDACRNVERQLALIHRAMERLARQDPPRE